MTALTTNPETHDLGNDATIYVARTEEQYREISKLVRSEENRTLGWNQNVDWVNDRYMPNSEYMTVVILTTGKYFYMQDLSYIDDDQTKFTVVFFENKHAQEKTWASEEMYLIQKRSEPIVVEAEFRPLNAPRRSPQVVAQPG